MSGGRRAEAGTYTSVERETIHERKRCAPRFPSDGRSVFSIPTGVRIFVRLMVGTLAGRKGRAWSRIGGWVLRAAYEPLETRAVWSSF